MKTCKNPILYFALLLFLSSLSCYANTTVRVPTQFSTIADAVNAVDEDGEIQVLSSFTEFSSIGLKGKKILIVSYNSSYSAKEQGATIRATAGDAIVLDDSTVTLEGFSIKADNGTGILFQNTTSSLTLSGCSVSGCFSNGIDANTLASNLKLTNCVISNNPNGSGLSWSSASNADLSIDQCSFTGNGTLASHAGLRLKILGGVQTWSISSSIFSDNARNIQLYCHYTNSPQLNLTATLEGCKFYDTSSETSIIASGVTNGIAESSVDMNFINCLLVSDKNEGCVGFPLPTGQVADIEFDHCTFVNKNSRPCITNKLAGGSLKVNNCILTGGSIGFNDDPALPGKIFSRHNLINATETASGDVVLGGNEIIGKDPLFIFTEGIYEEIDLFVMETDGYAIYRIPSVVVTNNGTVLAFCEGRKNGQQDDGDIDLLMKRSTDGGKTWSEQVIVYEEGGDEEITIGNNCPVVDRITGTILLPICRNNRAVLMTKSNDDGLSWSQPVDISDSVKESSGSCATGPGVGIQLSRGPHAGRLLIPFRHNYSRVFYSDDHGQSWTLGNSLGQYTNECQVVELIDGRVLINMRNYWYQERDVYPERDGMRAVARSEDAGASWSDLYFDSTLIEPVCQASIIRYDDRYILFSNPACPRSNPDRFTYRDRVNMTVRLSADECENWAVSKTIHPGPSAYSCLAVLPDKSIACFYEGGETYQYEKIIFARFDLGWLMDSPPDYQLQENSPARNAGADLEIDIDLDGKVRDPDNPDLGCYEYSSYEEQKRGCWTLN